MKTCGEKSATSRLGGSLGLGGTNDVMVMPANATRIGWKNLMRLFVDQCD
jgi:hypothetical protein